MIHRLIVSIVLLACACLAGLHAQQSAPSLPPQFAAEAELVTVDVSVLDSHGRPVTGLRQADFLVFENGLAREIAAFHAVVVPEHASGAVESRRAPVSTNTDSQPTGRTFVVVFDDLHLTHAQARRGRSAVAQFLKTGVAPGDRVTLVATGSDVWWHARMPAQRDDLLDILEALPGRYPIDSSAERISEWEAYRIEMHQDMDVALQVKRRFDSHGAAGQSRLSGPIPREAMAKSSLEGIIDPVVRARAAAVYNLALSRNKATLRLLTRALHALSDTPGQERAPRVAGIRARRGAARDAGNGPRVAPGECADLLHQYPWPCGAPRPHDCRCARSAGRAGHPAGAHRRQARVGGGRIDCARYGRVRRGAHERPGSRAPAGVARVAFVLPPRVPPARPEAGRPLPPHRSSSAGEPRGVHRQRAPRLLRHGRSDIRVAGRRGSGDHRRARRPLRAAGRSASHGGLRLRGGLGRGRQGARDDGGRRAAVRVRGTEWPVRGRHGVSHRGPRAKSGQRYRYDEKIEMALQPETRDRLWRTWYPVSREFLLPAGVYRARVVVRDLAGGSLGSVTHEFEVPDPAGFRISTPVLSDIAESSGTAASLRPLLIARRSFPTGGMLYCQYLVYGAAQDPETGLPRVTAGYELRRMSGTAFKAAAPTPIAAGSSGTLRRLHGISLEGAAPGDYELVLTIVDEVTKRTLTAREPLTIVGEH